MGTNYYVHIIEGKPCPHCGTPIHGEIIKLHIGKQSAGWSFLWHGHGAGNGHPALKSREQWQEFLEGRVVYDEYGQEHELCDFNRMVVSPDSYYFGRPVINACTEAIERDGHDRKDYWRDPWGWSFCKGDWS